MHDCLCTGRSAHRVEMLGRSIEDLSLSPPDKEHRVCCRHCIRFHCLRAWVSYDTRSLHQDAWRIAIVFFFWLAFPYPVGLTNSISASVFPAFISNTAPSAIQMPGTKTQS
jgi:hypothetical protein